LYAAEHDVYRYVFFQGMRAESVCTGKVNQFDGLVVRLQCANVPLNRDARVISDALAKACQAIKECALAGIRATDNRYAGIRLPANGNVL
jgi:hypothetical protein